MKEEKGIKIGFQIKGIELLDSCLNAPQQPLPNNGIFQFDINLEHRLSVDNSIVIVVCTVSIYNESKDQLLGQLKASCIYLVENLTTYINTETQALQLPDHFISTLNSVSISTTRGLMFAFFRGTFLHNAVLPIIDPSTFSSEKK